ncbi:MAG TPA: alpha/beta fold hydrolase [Devosiaceae bacterium]
MERNAIGWKELRAIDGERGIRTVATVRETSSVLADALTDFAFGEVFSRAELGRRERELATVAALGAMGGAEPQLRIHLEAALNVGADPDELVALAEHLTLYAGFPRALNLLRETRAVLDQLGYRVSPPASRIRLGDHETLVCDTGGPGEPVILVHALGLDRRMWRDVALMLGQDHRVISYDLRGHGHAAAATAPIGLKTYSDDLVALLDRLGLKKAHIVGLSLGGSIAQTLALADPERVDRLGIVASTAWNSPAFEGRAVAAETAGMDAQVIPTLTRWFTPAALAENGWGVRFARDRVRRAFVADWAGAWRALAAVDTADRLGQIACPSFVVAGERDPSTPPDLMRELASAIPGASFEVIADGPHMVSLEKPAELADAIRRGLARDR